MAELTCRRAGAAWPRTSLNGAAAQELPSQDQPSQELDQALVARVQRGDSAAFDLLVRKYQHRIAALISRYIHDWSEVQDVAQDTFLRAYRAMGISAAMRSSIRGSTGSQ